MLVQVDICVHCFTAVRVSPSTKDYGLQTIWCASQKYPLLLLYMYTLPLQAKQYQIRPLSCFDYQGEDAHISIQDKSRFCCETTDLAAPSEKWSRA